MTLHERYTAAYQALNTGIKRVERQKARGRLVLDGIHTKLHTVLPEIELIRWSDILFITLADFHIYYRIQYGVDDVHLQIGQWYTSRRGSPRFRSHRTWVIEFGDERSEGDWLHLYQERSLIEIVEVLGWAEAPNAPTGGSLTGGPFYPLCDESRYFGNRQQRQPS
jgi:hypothetical protein